jgi:hypothetical protein
VQVAGAAWRVAMRIMVGIVDLVQRIDDDRIGQVLDDRTIRMLGDAMCDLHRARGDKERMFLN